MIPTGQRLTGRELLAFQQKASRHLAFSLTDACPLRCEHCIASAVPVRRQKEVTVTPEQAHRYAGQMAAIREEGVERVSFTGGEPLLAKAPLQILSEAAAAAGMTSTVITACPWAGDAESARHTVRRYPYITRWHLSTDRFHTAFLPPGHLLRAAEAVLEADREVLIRFTVSQPPAEEDQRLYDFLRTHLPEGVPIAVQPVSHAGRAADLETEIPSGLPQQVPCLSTGPAIRRDGSVSPCCASLIGQKEGHPFVYAAASEAGLAAVYRQWQADPLLRLIRAVGFTPVLPWIQEGIPDHPLFDGIPNHPCEICIALWKHPAAAPLLQQVTRRPDVKRKIDQLFAAVFETAPLKP